MQAQILDLLADLSQGWASPTSHDLAVVRMIADQVQVMQRGPIVESGTREQIFDNPQDEYTQEPLTAIPGGSPAV